MSFPIGRFVPRIATEYIDVAVSIEVGSSRSLERRAIVDGVFFPSAWRLGGLQCPVKEGAYKKRHEPGTSMHHADLGGVVSIGDELYHPSRWRGFGGPCRATPGEFPTPAG